MAPGGYSLSHSLIWAVSGLSLISGKVHMRRLAPTQAQVPLLLLGINPHPGTKTGIKRCLIPNLSGVWGGVTLPQGGRFSALPWQG